MPLYKTIHVDVAEMPIRFHYTLHHRRWLCMNQKLLHTFISYCTLHNSQSHRLTAALMELLLLQMEVQQGRRPWKFFTSGKFFVK